MPAAIPVIAGAAAGAYATSATTMALGKVGAAMFGGVVSMATTAATCNLLPPAPPSERATCPF